MYVNPILVGALGVLMIEFGALVVLAMLSARKRRGK